MASLYVEEYTGVAGATSVVGPYLTAVPAPQEPSITGQLLTIGASSTAGSPFNAATKLIRVHADAICSIAIGPSPTAVATRKRMAAGQTDFYGVRPGDTIAVIVNT